MSSVIAVNLLISLRASNSKQTFFVSNACRPAHCFETLTGARVTNRLLTVVTTLTSN